MEQILNYMPYKVKGEILKYFNNNIEEIRLRVGRPLSIKYEDNIKITSYIITTEKVDIELELQGIACLKMDKFKI